MKKEPPPLTASHQIAVAGLVLHKDGVALQAGYFSDRPAAYICKVHPQPDGQVRLEPVALLLDSQIIEEFRTKLASVIGSDLAGPHTQLLIPPDDSPGPESPN